MVATVFSPDASGPGQILVLGEMESHHLALVLRAKEQDPVRILNGSGGIGEGLVISLHRNAASVQIDRWRQFTQPATRITLAQSLPKGDKTDLILQKAVELGVMSISLIQTDHSVTRFKDDNEGKKARWKEILVNACKQSGNPWLPTLTCFGGMDLWLASGPEHPLLMADLSPAAKALKSYLKQKPRPTSATVVVGPEGDFSERERQNLYLAGADAINLGSRVLRTETAAIHLLSILYYEWLDDPITVV